MALGVQLPLVVALAPPWQLPPRGWLLLLASGVLGIALGDSLFFAALRRLGTRRTLTIEAGGPAVTTLVGALLLQERPGALQLLGVALISLAVLLVVRGRARGGAPDPAAPRGPAAGRPPLPSGVPLAIGALLCGSGGSLLSRAALLSGPISPLQAATVRLAAASLVALPLLPRLAASAGGLPALAVALRGSWPLVLLATLLGTCAGIVLQQMALAGLPGGLAVALLATAPVMAVPLAWWLEGDRPGWRGGVAALAALAGVSLVVAPAGG